VKLAFCALSIEAGVVRAAAFANCDLWCSVCATHLEIRCILARWRSYAWGEKSYSVMMGRTVRVREGKLLEARYALWTPFYTELVVKTPISYMFLCQQERRYLVMYT
jgi:hypothetical protein